jgi:AbrB family looped-hinge helix DNA binding protein
MTIADSVWLATALLHQQNSGAIDFSVQEIIGKATDERLIQGYRPSLQVHASKHCVANKPPNPGRYRILLETTRGRRRLFKEGDPFHPDRREGKTRPSRDEVPAKYQSLIDWYDRIYSKKSGPANVSSIGALTKMTNTPRVASERPNSDFAELDAIQAEPVFVGANGMIVLPERLRSALGIKEGSCLSIYREGERLILQPITEDFIRSLRGCLKGPYSLVEDREREHRDDRY